MAQLLILGTVDGLSCALGAACLIYLKVTSSETATISVTGATQGALTQLPIGVPVAGAAPADGYAQFAMMLDPDSDADDNLALDVQLCSGAAELFVGHLLVRDLQRPRRDGRSRGRAGGRRGMAHGEGRGLRRARRRSLQIHA